MSAKYIIWCVMTKSLPAEFSTRNATSQMSSQLQWVWMWVGKSSETLIKYKLLTIYTANDADSFISRVVGVEEDETGDS